MKDCTIHSFKRWNTIIDYESDEGSVVLINSKGKKVVEFGYVKFTKKDFDKFKNN